MNYLKELETWDLDSNGAGIKTLRVIVEIPKNSSLKYELTPCGKYMTIVRAMHHRYKYPYNYGSIPQTNGGDNDPLDAIVVYKRPIAVGTILNCLVVGVIKTVDNGEVDDKILCVPYFDHPSKINIKKILKYLNHYKYPDQDSTTIKEVLGPHSAIEIIENSIKSFKEKYKNEV